VSLPSQAKLEAKEREHFKKKGISFEGEPLKLAAAAAAAAALAEAD
jgi:hypothetical protein